MKFFVESGRLLSLYPPYYLPFHESKMSQLDKNFFMGPSQDTKINQGLQY